MKNKERSKLRILVVTLLFKSYLNISILFSFYFLLRYKNVYFSLLFLVLLVFYFFFEIKINKYSLLFKNEK